MRTNILKHITILLVLAIGISCKKDVKQIEMPFWEFAMSEQGCWWENYVPGKMVIINSKEELKKYLICTESGWY